MKYESTKQSGEKKILDLHHAPYHTKIHHNPTKSESNPALVIVQG